MDSTDSSASQPQLPPGFRFHPTDEELVVHYLKKKAASAPLPVSIIAEIDLYKFDPWELPAKAVFGEQEWYFFTPRERKYPNGVRPNRAATSGYWKATGTDKPVHSSGSSGGHKIGVKKALVFYGGKPPKGVKTNWIMHEYRLSDNKSISKPPGCDPTHKKASLRLDDWVLCRIYKKNSPQRSVDHQRYDSMGDMYATMPASTPVSQQNPKQQAIKAYGALLENEHNMFEGIVGNGGININNNSEYISQLPTSSSNPPLPMPKRTLTSLYWNQESETGSDSSKRFTSNEGTIKTHENMNAIATMLSQLPQSPLLGSIADGGFRQQYQLHGLNWYSN
ncbi:hypothetical protein ACSBR1_028715 [Camellia fascicularis]